MDMWLCQRAGRKNRYWQRRQWQYCRRKNVKKLLEDLPNKITTILGIVCDVNLHETADGDYIEIVVEPQPNPVNYKGEYETDKAIRLM
jgi:hypothetical protein